ncbi:MAG: YdeI/OmpD-associated family protein [Propionicimonas sp.]|nr:YdeI/OmpD-associated family protein [Propionicimonas sp.]
MEPELILPDRAAWRAWLDTHEDDTPDGVWLVLAKKGRPAPTTLTRDEALEEVLCSGWIDAMSRGRDEDSSLQRYVPRRSRSTWSARNVALAEQLIADGRMRPRGLIEVERARADGRWEAAYEGSRDITVPDDLAAALASHPLAAANFALLSSQNRYALLFRLHHVKTPPARARNIERYLGMLERGETVYPQKQPLAGGQ